MFHPFVLPIDVNVARDKNKIYSSIYKVEKDSFENKYLEISKEWHPTLNGDLKPNMFKPHSDYKAWWLCSKCGFEWPATIGHRVEGAGCPNCGIGKSAKAKSKKVAMVDLKTCEVLIVFESISEAGRQTKISIGNIVAVCKGTRLNAGGYYWKYM